MSFNQDVQTLEPGSLVQLIEIDGTDFGLDTVLRFHAYNIASDGWKSFAAENLPSIIWQGNEYDPHPYELTGVEMTSSGTQPTPKLSVGNVGNYVTALCLQFDDLVKAKSKYIPRWLSIWMRLTGRQATPVPILRKSAFSFFMLTQRQQKPAFRWILSCVHRSTFRACSCPRVR